MDEKTLKRIRRMAADAEQRRSHRLPRWRELSRLLLPSHGQFTGEEKQNRRNDVICNNAGERALRKSAAGLTAGMTPAGLPWFRHVPRTPEMREADGARAWADAVDEQLRSILSDGGFYSAIHSFNLELLAFGAALMCCEEDPRSVARYSCPTCGTWAISLGVDGTPDFVVRRLWLSAESMPRRFPEERISQRVRNLAEKGSFEPVELVHVVFRREGGKADAMRADKLPWGTLWWEAHEQEGYLAEGGCLSMPYFFTAWHSCRGDYGTGPGDEALPDQRALETYERYKAEGIEKTVSPPLLVPSGIGPVDGSPGAENVVMSASAAEQLKPLYQINFAQSLPYLQEEIRILCARIDDSLLASVFSSVSMDTRPAQMSATEFMARRREAVQQMGPALSSYEPKVLTRLLDRTYDLAVRAGRIPNPPENLMVFSDFTLEQEYLGPLSQALRQSGAESTARLLEMAAQIGQAVPQALDKIDADQCIDELAVGFAAPGAVVRSDDAVAKLRQDRAQAEAQAKMLEMQGAAPMAPVN